MSQVKRIRIPTAQQLQRWSNLITNMLHMESLDYDLEQLGAPNEAEWDNFLSVLNQLESTVVNLSDDFNAEVLKEDMSHLSINVKSNKRKL
jgi:hypothetical protein